MIACRNTTVTTASDLPAMMPHTGSAVAPSRLSAPYRRSNATAMAWPVKAVEITAQRHDHRNKGGGAVWSRRIRGAAASTRPAVWIGDEHGQQQLFAVAQQQLQFQCELAASICGTARGTRVRGESACGEGASVIGAAFPRKREVPPAHRCVLVCRRRGSRSQLPAGQLQEHVFQAALLHSHVGGQHVDLGTPRCHRRQNLRVHRPSTR